MAVEPVKNSSEREELAGKLIRDWSYLFGLRGNWNSHWTEIAQRIRPMEMWLFQNFQQLSQQGDKRTSEIFDSTGILALLRFGAIMDSLLTPQDQFWSNVKPDDDYLLKDRPTRLWFEKANQKLFKLRYDPRANFTAQNQEQYISLGAYGTGSLFIDALAGHKGIRYKHVHLSECYLQENHQGVIDRNCRRFMLTARQAVQQFGENCPDTIKEVVGEAPDRQFFFLHWVLPREDRDPDRKDFKGMPWASYYVSEEGAKIVAEGGYRCFPYAISRYYQAPNEAYGRSPAMDALPALKTLNEQKKTMLKQGHRAVDPVLLAHDDGVMDGFNLAPGAMNYGGVSADGKLLIQTLPIGNVQAGKELMDDERKLINDTFLVSLMQVLEENPQMSATEVLERVREKGILMAPTIGRQRSEYLGPMIEREMDVAISQGELDEMTPAMREAKGEYKITYDSPITRAMKAEWASGATRTFENLVAVAQATGDPSVLDYINFDVAAPELASIYGTPDSWIRSKEDIMRIRKQRQQQQGVETAIKAAPAAAGIMKAHAAVANGKNGGIPGASNQ